MSWFKNIFLPIAIFGAISSMLVACGRRSSDDSRVAANGNITIDGAGVVSSSTLEGQPYTIRVLRVYKNSGSYTTTGSAYTNNNYNYNNYNNNSAYAANCQSSANSYTGTGYYTGYYQQTTANTILIDIVVNGVCRTMTLSSPGSLYTDADLGLEISYSCDVSNCDAVDTVYINIVGRNPRSYTTSNGSSYTALPGGGLSYGYTNNWTMQPNTEIKQIGLLAIVSQIRIAATIELQSLYSQRLRMDQLMSELQRTNYEYTSH